MPKVIVVGSSNMDVSIALERLPVAGETLLGRDGRRSCGGKGANQAVAAKRAGAEVALLSKLGLDSDGDVIAQTLRSAGLPDTGLLRDHGNPTGLALILVDRLGRNMIAVAPGSNHALSVEDVRRASSLIADSAVLLTQLETPLDTIREALAIAKAHRVRTILNPAPALALPPEVLMLTDVLTPNEREAETLTGLSEPAVAASLLLDQGAGSVVITLADRGAMLRTRTGTRFFPAYSVTSVDSTAAGDAFNGALACALAEGRTLEEAIGFANAAGALATTKRGALGALPTRREIDRMCR